MASEVIMPQLGESVVEGTVTKWLKVEGDTVAEFEALLEINTDKVDTEIPSPSSGTLLRVYVNEGQTVNAGTLLAMIGEENLKLPPPCLCLTTLQRGPHRSQDKGKTLDSYPQSSLGLLQSTVSTLDKFRAPGEGGVSQRKISWLTLKPDHPRQLSHGRNRRWASYSDRLKKCSAQSRNQFRQPMAVL
jgi:pyruvate/2-oxoglutarate dehydrogenase complex dihydrolipoamide acyltransferase (E2) component